MLSLRGVTLSLLSIAASAEPSLLAREFSLYFTGMRCKVYAEVHDIVGT